MSLSSAPCQKKWFTTFALRQLIGMVRVFIGSFKISLLVYQRKNLKQMLFSKFGVLNNFFYTSNKVLLSFNIQPKTDFLRLSKEEMKLGKF